MKLTDIDGIGPSRAEALRAAGVETVEQLARLDSPVEGVSTAQLSKWQRRAKKVVSRPAFKRLTFLGLKSWPRDVQRWEVYNRVFVRGVPQVVRTELADRLLSRSDGDFKVEDP